LIAGKVKRQDLFVVTKLPLFAMDPSAVRPTLEQSLKNLCIDYLDLYLIHSPIAVEVDSEKGTIKKNDDGKVVLKSETNHIGIWREMEKLVDEGKIRSIGVSNFNSLQVLVLNMSLDT
jgi:alcohol dehydrogenase (NADP+)